MFPRKVLFCSCVLLYRPFRGTLLCLTDRLYRAVLISSPDPSSVVRRQEGMEAARKRMQEELDAKAAVFLEKQREVRLTVHN